MRNTNPLNVCCCLNVCLLQSNDVILCTYQRTSVLLLYYSDVGQISVLLVKIQTVSHYELIRNGKTGIVYLYLLLHKPLRLVKKGAQTDIRRASLF